MARIWLTVAQWFLSAPPTRVYGQAYRTLKRRMKVLGIELPPASELMPGPIAEIGDGSAVEVPEGEPRVEKQGDGASAGNGASSNGAGDLDAAEAPS